VSEPNLKRIEELFHRAVELNPEQRAAFLEIESAGDPELKARVEALLAHDRSSPDATDFLESPIQRLAPPNDSATLRPGPGESLPEPDSFRPVIPGYEILEELGRGGMGVVYEARQLGLNRLVALKMLLSIGPVSREDLARFRVEAESLAQLHHPNIIQIYEIGEYEGLPYFAMEYVEGPSLAQLTGGAGQSPKAAARLVEILARAMAAVHQRGIIHRDLKPANVLLATGEESSSKRSHAEPDTGRQPVAKPPLTTRHSPLTHYMPKITDFGLAKRFDGGAFSNAHPGAVTQSGTVIGTPWYMAPEQARGDISGLGPWTDLYSLGAILYELLTGRPPIQEESPAATLMKLLTDDPLPPSHWRRGLPSDLDTICLKCLEKEPRRRYGSAAELAEDLRRYQAGEPIKARPISAAERIWRWCRRQPLAASALASTAVLGLALLITVLAYNARLREALSKEKELTENQRARLVRIHVTIGMRELDSGDAFAALLWLTEAMILDEANSDHRQRILEILEHVPWLLKVAKCEGEVLTCRITSSECLLAEAHPDNAVRIWDVQNGKYAGQQLEHPAAVVLAEFSPDGKSLATASNDGALRLWRLDNGQSDLILKPAKLSSPPRSKLKRLMFNPTGSVLVAQTVDETVHGWIVDNGKHISLEGFMDYSPQRALNARVADGDKGTILSSNGKFAYALDKSGDELLWEPPNYRVIRAHLEIDHPGSPKALSADGHFAALVDSKNTVRIVETKTGKVHGKPLAHPHPVLRVLFSPQGELLLTVDAERAARLWRWETSEQPILTMPSGILEGIIPFTQFSLNGHFLATLGGDNRLRVWDVAKRKQATPPLHARGPIHFEAFSSDGRRLVVVGKDHTVDIWDLSPCERENGHLIQPGLNRDFLLEHLSVLVQELAGARIDEEQHLVPLDHQNLLANWERFQKARNDER
jgi:serine/threonine protein kinase/WD40 repeat protein